MTGILQEYMRKARVALENDMYDLSVQHAQEAYKEAKSSKNYFGMALALHLEGRATYQKNPSRSHVSKVPLIYKLLLGF